MWNTEDQKALCHRVRDMVRHAPGSVIFNVALYLAQNVLANAPDEATKQPFINAMLALIGKHIDPRAVIRMATPEEAVSNNVERVS